MDEMGLAQAMGQGQGGGNKLRWRPMSISNFWTALFHKGKVNKMALTI